MSDTDKKFTEFLATPLSDDDTKYSEEAFDDLGSITTTEEISTKLDEIEDKDLIELTALPKKRSRFMKQAEDGSSCSNTNISEDVQKKELVLETTEELAEKEHFFQELEGNASSTIDYGKLNAELDDENSTQVQMAVGTMKPLMTTDIKTITGDNLSDTEVNDGPADYDTLKIEINDDMGFSKPTSTPKVTDLHLLSNVQLETSPFPTSEMTESPSNENYSAVPKKRRPKLAESPSENNSAVSKKKGTHRKSSATSTTGSKIPVRGPKSNSSGNDDEISLSHQVSEQEKLLSGFQHENERTYSELRKVEKLLAESQKTASEEVQKLKLEVTSLKAELEQKDLILRRKALQADLQKDQSDKLRDLQTDLRTSQHRIEYLTKSLMDRDEAIASLKVEVQEVKTPRTAARSSSVIRTSSSMPQQKLEGSVAVNQPMQPYDVVVREPFARLKRVTEEAPPEIKMGIMSHGQMMLHYADAQRHSVIPEDDVIILSSKSTATDPVELPPTSSDSVLLSEVTADYTKPQFTQLGRLPEELSKIDPTMAVMHMLQHSDSRHTSTVPDTVILSQDSSSSRAPKRSVRSVQYPFAPKSSGVITHPAISAPIRLQTEETGQIFGRITEERGRENSEDEIRSHHFTQSRIGEGTDFEEKGVTSRSSESRRKPTRDAAIVDEENEHLKMEVKKLQAEIEWYAENQELLNHDAKTLKEKCQENRQLREKNRCLQLELEAMDKRFQMYSKKKTSVDLFVDMVSSGDLRKKVVQDSEETIAVLERRVSGLQNELELVEDEAKRDLRTLMQEYKSMEIRYKKEIGRLEQNCKGLKGMAVDISDKVIERKLDAVRESYQTQIDRLEERKLALENAMVSSPGKNGKAKRTTKAEKVLACQRVEIQQLKESLQRTQDDKDELGRRLALWEKQVLTDGLVNSRSTGIPAPPPPTDTPSQAGKPYKASAFTSPSTTDKLEMENNDLKNLIAELQLSFDQERVEMKAKLARAEETMTQLKEQQNLKLENSALKAKNSAINETELALKLENQREQYYREKQMLESQLATQTALVDHLKRQVENLEEDRAEMDVMRKREVTLESRISHLLTELHETKKLLSPDMTRFSELRERISSIEHDFEERLKEMRTEQFNSNLNNSASHQNYWRRMAVEKHEQLMNFKKEFHDILNILETLQQEKASI